MSDELRWAVARTIEDMHASGTPAAGVATIVIGQAQHKLLEDKRRLVEALRELVDCHKEVALMLGDPECDPLKQARALLEELGTHAECGSCDLCHCRGCQDARSKAP